MSQSSPRDSTRLLSDRDIERRKRLVGLDADDVARVRKVKDLLVRGANRFTDAFFAYLADTREAAPLFDTADILEQAKRLKREHLVAMAAGDYGKAYVEQRLKLGLLYSMAGLDVAGFLGAFHHLMRSIGTEIMSKSAADPEQAFKTFLSLKKVAFFDIGIVAELLIEERERTIARQQEAIRELSTPVLRVDDRLLVVPIIGTLDSLRARQLTDSLLEAIGANRARAVVLDITGVGAVDSKVAQHLIQAAAAARLMGTTVILTGLSAQVAEALVGLGIDLSSIDSFADLQAGLDAAHRVLAALAGERSAARRPA